jgi:hypothetical protein
MQGLITERDFETAERWFPGIRRFYRALVEKPATFLELVWKYEHRSERSSSECVAPARGRSRRPAR